jgi:phospholipid-binding lipoprotein MlaA
MLQMLSWRFGNVAPLLVAACLLSGCATPPSDPEDRADYELLNDPWEPGNRTMFEVNMTLDRNIGKPVATAYRDNVPDQVQRGIHNVIRNLGEPYTFVNDVLQLEGTRALNTFGRFVSNTILGVCGIIDASGDMPNLPFHKEDFGQTLAVWGVPEGPYAMLPVFGPSNPRDIVGLVVDHFGDPLSYVLPGAELTYITTSQQVAGMVDERASYLDPLDQLEKTSLDFYAAIRSISRQRRLDEIRNQKVSGFTDSPGGKAAPAKAK